MSNITKFIIKPTDPIYVWDRYERPSNSYDTWELAFLPHLLNIYEMIVQRMESVHPDYNYRTEQFKKAVFRMIYNRSSGKIDFNMATN